MKKVNVVAAVFRKNECTFIAKRKSNYYDKMWEFPGGKVNINEKNEDALKREIKEELNIDIKVGNKICSTSIIQKNNVEIKIEFIECESNFKNLLLNNHYESKWIKSPNEVSNWAPGDLPALNSIFNIK